MKRPVQILLMMLTLGLQSENAQARPQPIGVDSKMKLEAMQVTRRETSRFPSRTLIAGVNFERLRGVDLSRSISGTSISSKVLNGDVSDKSFERDGRFGVFGDFGWEVWGRYDASNDLIVTWMRNEKGKPYIDKLYALYGTSDQRFALAWMGRKQKLVVVEINLEKVR